jgi:hypothetical protein
MGQTADKDEPKYWYNLKTGKVEHGLLSAALYRVGPFETAAEAARAPEVIKARAEAWRKEEGERD